MSRKSRNAKTVNVPEPVDIIDLTEESPTVLRQRSRRLQQDIENIPVESQEVEAITIADNGTNTAHNIRARFSEREVIIDLDETINLDDSTVPNHTPNKKSLLTCPICFESLEGENIKAMSTPCGHLFCYPCLEKISQTLKKCSICQRALKISKCIRIHI